MSDRLRGLAPRQLRVLSLFSGIGGIDLGLERAGMEVVAHSEIDPYACRVLAKHWPGVPNLGDITTIDAADVPPLDVIAGGFPCQDISLAGKGAGIIEGSRSGLWSEYARLVRELRPRYVIVENVAALAARGLDRVLGDLAALGYSAWWDCIPAASVGAPHRRDRLFIVATRSDVAPFDTDASPMQWTAQLGREPNRDPASSAAANADCERSERAGATEERRQPADGGSWPVVEREARADADGGGFAELAQRDGERRCGVDGEPRRNAVRLRDPGSDAAGSGLEGARLPGRSADVCVAADARGVEHESGGAAKCGPGTEGVHGRPADHWRAEPDVGRVAHGIPKRVDRLRCLGNAVVPQVAQYIGELVVAHHAAQLAMSTTAEEATP